MNAKRNFAPIKLKRAVITPSKNAFIMFSQGKELFLLIISQTKIIV